jgi:hypothetical protein
MYYRITGPMKARLCCYDLLCPEHIPGRGGTVAQFATNVAFELSGARSFVGWPYDDKALLFCPAVFLPISPHSLPLQFHLLNASFRSYFTNVLRSKTLSRNNKENIECETSRRHRKASNRSYIGVIGLLRLSQTQGLTIFMVSAGFAS